MAGDAQIGSLLVLLEANTAKMDEKIQQSKKRFDGLNSSIGLVKTGLAALAGAEIFREVVQATAEAEKAQALLASQIKATGDASGISMGQMLEMAESFQKTTTYSHVQIEQIQSELMAFTNITGDQFKRTIQAVLDFSAVTGRDASESVRTLGQAINNPISSMGRLTQAGISLDESTKANIKSLQESGHLVEAQTLLLSKLEKSYGGAAAAARDTLGGALTGLKNDFDDLLEGKGGGLQGATDGVKALDAALQDPAVQQGIASLVGGLLRLVGVLGQVAAAFARVGEGIGEFFAKAQGYAGNFDDQIAELNGHIQQTKDQIAGLEGGGTPKDSPAIKQLEVQLNDYQVKLAIVKGQQDALITGHPAQSTPMPTINDIAPRLAPLDMTVKSLPVLSEGNYAGLKQTDGYEQLVQDQEKVIAIWKQNDPSAYMQQQIAETKALVGTVVNGQIFTTEDAAKHIDDLKDKFSQSMNEMTVFADQAARNIQDTLANALFQPFHHGLRGMLEDFAKTLEKMVDQLIAAQLLNNFFGGNDPSGKGSGQAGLAALISKGLGSYFGGGHAGGGPVDPSNFYMVGEQGPELFVPSSAGTIVPNGSFGGGSGDVHVNIDARGSDAASTAKLIAMGAQLENSLKSQMEYRLQRGGWPRGRHQ